jgi:hypothetical protein
LISTRNARRTIAGADGGEQDLTDSLLTNIVIFICGVMILWYFAGNSLNRRRARELAHTLGSAASELGEGFSQMQGRPNQALKTSVVKPRAPYARVTIHFVLEAREILFLWLINRYVRGKRDQMVVHAELLSPPTRALLLADPETQLGRLALDKAHENGHVAEPITVRSGLTLELWGQGKTEEKLAADFARNGVRPGYPLWVLRTQRSSPQLLLICGLQGGDTEEMPLMFRRLRALAADVVKGEVIGRHKGKARE